MSNDLSLGNRFARGSIVAFGMWTALAQCATVAGGTPAQLIPGAAVLLSVLVGTTLYRLRKRTPPASSPETSAPGFFGLENQPAPRHSLVGLYLFGMAILALVAIFLTPEILAAAVAIIAAGVLAVEVRQPAIDVPPVSSPGWERSLVVFAFLVALLAISVHRPDSDDGMYINMATTAADFPDEPLLSFDGSLPDPGVALPEPAYRSHSLEILAGLFARISGLPAIAIMHIGIAFWAALLAVFAQAELQKILVPKQWLLATVFTILLLLALGETHRSYGNFAVVRIHQGKGILLTAILPLLITYAIHFMRSPSTRNWGLLLLAMIAATGISSAALVIAPVATALALVAAWGPSREATWRLLCGLATALYPVGLAWILGLL